MPAGRWVVFDTNVYVAALREGVDGAAFALIRTRAPRTFLASVVSAELRAGANEGNRIPLVPEERASAGVDVDVVAGLALRADALYVGEQVLQNDEANDQSQLDSYDVVNLRASWRPGARKSAGSGARIRGLLVFVEMRNLFDEEYATRGIYAFDFSTNLNEIFLSPAPGRRFLGGVGWEF